MLHLYLSTEYIGYYIAVLSYVLCINQYIIARKAKKKYLSQTTSRFKDIVQLVKSLSRSSANACSVAESELAQIIRNSAGSSLDTEKLSRLTASIASTQAVTDNLVRFCARVNEEHKDDYEDAVFNDIDKEFEDWHFFDENRSKNFKSKISKD